VAQVQFHEVTAAAGISTAAQLSYGAAWGDFDGNGCPDLYVTRHSSPVSLYQNRCDGTFQDVAPQVIPPVTGRDKHGVMWCDLDNDGDLDLIELTGAGGGTGSNPKHLFINIGGGFREEATVRGLSYPLGRGRMPLCFDYNGDRRLDVLYTNLARPEAPTALFRQKSDGRFQDVTSAVGPYLGDRDAWFSQISTLGTNGWFLLVHGTVAIYDLGALPLQDARKKLGLPKISKVRDIAIADFDGNGAVDLLMCRRDEGVRLLLKRNSGFIDATATAGLAGITDCYAVAAADFDNDMDMDFYLVRSRGTQNLPNMLWLNQGKGTFVEVLNAGGARGTSLGIGDYVTVADYDLDGFLDLFVGNGEGEAGTIRGPLQLFHNAGNSHQSLQIDLQGTRSNRDGIGARLALTVGGVTQIREQGGGVHAAAQDQARIHFGLGTNSTVERLVITWPSGRVQTLTNIRANQILRVVEP
jgi:hypothetical protein